MKAFFEEYGFVLVSVAVIAILITIVSGSDGIGSSIETGLNNTVTGMTTKLGTFVSSDGNIGQE